MKMGAKEQNAIDQGKNRAHLAPDRGPAGAEQRSGIYRRPRHHPPAHGPDHDQHPPRGRENRSRSPQKDLFAEKRNSRRQRRVGLAVPQVLFRRTAPGRHRRRSRRAPESRPRRPSVKAEKNSRGIWASFPGKGSGAFLRVESDSGAEKSVISTQG